MQGYCEKVNTLLNDKFYFSLADGNLQFYRDSSMSKLVDCVVLTNKTVIQDKGEKALKLTNIFMQSGRQAPKFVLKFEDSNIRSQWRSAIDGACRPATVSASKSLPPNASRNVAPVAAMSQSSGGVAAAYQSSVMPAKGQTLQNDPQNHINSLHKMQERIETLEKQEANLEAQRMELNGQLQALCRNGDREHPANKPKIARIMKDIKAKKDAKTVVSGMLGKLKDQCNLITSFLQTAEANEAFKPDPLLKLQMAQLAKDIELNSDHQAELQQEYEEVVSIFSEEPFIDDEELARQLEEIHPSTSASAAQHPLPALSLPAAGSKAVLSAWGAAARSTRDDSSEDELERYWIARLLCTHRRCSFGCHTSFCRIRASMA